MGHRISREERFKKQDKYAYIMNESNPQKPVEKTEGPRKIAIRMYKEGKTLAQISSELPRNFSKENIITWLMDEFPNNEIRKYWMADKAKDIIDNNIKKRIDTYRKKHSMSDESIVRSISKSKVLFENSGLKTREDFEKYISEIISNCKNEEER